MKFLTELPDEEFLRHCWQIAGVAEEVLEKSKIMELRKVLPVLTDALAHLIGAEERWYDMVAGLVENCPQPPPSADEVIARIKNGLNGGD